MMQFEHQYVGSHYWHKSSVGMSAQLSTTPEVLFVPDFNCTYKYTFNSVGADADGNVVLAYDHCRGTQLSLEARRIAHVEVSVKVAQYGDGEITLACNGGPLKDSIFKMDDNMTMKAFNTMVVARLMQMKPSKYSQNAIVKLDVDCKNNAKVKSLLKRVKKHAVIKAVIKKPAARLP